MNETDTTIEHMLAECRWLAQEVYMNFDDLSLMINDLRDRTDATSCDCMTSITLNAVLSATNQATRAATNNALLRYMGKLQNEHRP